MHTHQECGGDLSWEKLSPPMGQMIWMWGQSTTMEASMWLEISGASTQRTRKIHHFPAWGPRPLQRIANAQPTTTSLLVERYACKHPTSHGQVQGMWPIMCIVSCSHAKTTILAITGPCYHQWNLNFTEPLPTTKHHNKYALVTICM